MIRFCQNIGLQRSDDVKSDWFLSAQEGNGKPRPRPELVQEMYVEAGVLPHIYQGYEFLKLEFITPICYKRSIYNSYFYGTGNRS